VQLLIDSAYLGEHATGIAAQVCELYILHEVNHSHFAKAARYLGDLAKLNPSVAAKYAALIKIRKENAPKNIASSKEEGNYPSKAKSNSKKHDDKKHNDEQAATKSSPEPDKTPSPEKIKEQGAEQVATKSLPALDADIAEKNKAK